MVLVENEETVLFTCTSVDKSCITQYIYHKHEENITIRQKIDGEVTETCTSLFELTQVLHMLSSHKMQLVLEV